MLWRQAMDTVNIKGKTYVLVPKDDLFEPHASMRFLVFWRDEFTCVYFGRSRFANHVLLNLEHLIPDGPYTFENLVTACAECNYGKGRSRFPEEILKQIEKMIQESSKRFQEKTGCIIPFIPHFSSEPSEGYSVVTEDIEHSRERLVYKGPSIKRHPI